MSTRFTTSDLFHEIDGHSFDEYEEFETAVIEIFNRHLDDFPPHYSYRDAIRWADRKGWLKTTNGSLEVRLERAAA